MSISYFSLLLHFNVICREKATFASQHSFPPVSLFLCYLNNVAFIECQVSFNADVIEQGNAFYG